MPKPCATDYLRVNQFLGDAVSTRAVATALECGLVDVLLPGSLDMSALETRTGLPPAGLELLLAALRRAGCVEHVAGRWQLTDAFQAVLRYRDLLTVKAETALAVAPDLLARFDLLLTDPAAFQQAARLFDLFDYGRCTVDTPANRAHAARWMRLTTALTRYEAALTFASVPFAAHRRLLDVGGNSGEFCLRVCAAFPHLAATVADLPVVCAVGAAHVASFSPVPPVRFVPFDLRRDALPAGHDLVVCKSLLHDWPEEAVGPLLDRILAGLEPGGRLVIFERRRPAGAELDPAFGDLPVWMFWHAYRQPDDYVRQLSAGGWTAVEHEEIMADMPWMLIQAVKPPAAGSEAPR
jgi:SAM-dependent methyltransferase